MKVDNIVKEELWRSIATYFFFSMLLAFISREGYFLIDVEVNFILPLFFTAICFSLLVWYRRKEQLLNPSIYSIIDSIFQSKKYEEKIVEVSKKEKVSIVSSMRKNISLLTITIFLYIIYLYASLAYNINQVFWFLILFFTGISISKIIYNESMEADQRDPMKLLIFYIIICVFIFVRYLVLGYPILPILKGGIIIGILPLLMVLRKKWSHRK